VPVATVRVGALGARPPRAAGRPAVRTMTVAARSRVRVRSRTRDDDVTLLAAAPVVLGLGLGVTPADYPRLEPLRVALGAELAATRPVVDRRWLPHARQIGLTGRSVAPRLYVAVGLAGAPEHLVGVTAAGTVLGVHPDPAAPLFDGCDVGIVGDWRDVVPPLAAACTAAGVTAAP
jgi:electron transfer flavoprotein alpha subunit